MTGFDPARLARALTAGHGGHLGIVYHDHGEEWVELALPARDDLAGADGHLASGAIAALMDTAAAMAVWMRRGRFVPHATLDLRLDHLRSGHSGATLVARAECYRINGPLAFARGIAYDGDRIDPVVHIVGSFMAFEA